VTHPEFPTRVDIREVSLRDGLQIEKPIPLAAKLELLAAVAATTGPPAGPRIFPAWWRPGASCP